MKKRVLTAIIAALVLIAVIAAVAILVSRNKNRNNDTPETTASEPVPQPEGEWTDGISVTVRYSGFGDDLGISVWDDNDDLWSLVSFDEEVFDCREEYYEANGNTFILTAKKLGSGVLKVESERKILTIGLTTDEKASFTIDSVTEEVKEYSNSDAEGYDTLMKEFGLKEIPKEAVVSMVDLSDLEEGYASVLLDYNEVSVWYHLSKGTAEDETEAAVDGEAADAEGSDSEASGDAADVESAPVTYEDGTVYTDNGWAQVKWEVNGVYHALLTEAGNEENLKALYELLK